MEMKNRELIEQRLETLQKRLEYLNNSKKAEIEIVSDKIHRNYKYPEHINEWIEAWMDKVKYYDKLIEEAEKQITVIEWVLED